MNRSEERQVQCEEENKKLIKEKNELIMEFNTLTKSHFEEVRRLKAVNEKLQTKLEDLRNLCCYLDDDRQECLRLAREWQHFGRHISSMLHSKESAYQEEVKSLNEQQETVVTENANLRKMCQDLQKRSTRNGLDLTLRREYVCGRCSQNFSGNGFNKEHSSEFDVFPQNSPDNTLLVNGRKKKVSFVEPDEMNGTDEEIPKHVPSESSDNMKEHMSCGILRNGLKKYHSDSHGSCSNTENESSVSDINRALEVLQIHANLESENSDMQQEPMQEKEVAVLKEMCNVVWKKLSSNDMSSAMTENYALSNDKTDYMIFEDLL